MMRWFLTCMLGVVISTSALAQAKPFGDAKVSAAVDAEINAALGAAKLKPVGVATDAEFLRRAYLDLLGRIPTTDEAKTYIQDKNADKERRLVAHLLAHAEMSAYWCDVLHGWLNGKSPDPGLGFKEFREYLRASLAENKPWDKLARELLLPVDGPTQPAAFFLGVRLRTSDKEERLDGMTVAVARTFFGVRMECAKCHDHPYVDEWKQHHYYGLASFLTRTELSIVNAKPTLRERDTGEVVFQNRKRESFKAELRFLDDKIFAEPKRDKKQTKKEKTDLPTIADFSPRKTLADYAFVPGNPYFKRAVVNRLWKELMGVGLVEPVDQIHSGNAPSHPKVFELLSEDFASHGFDLKRLIANIMQTEAYRRGSIWPDKERPTEKQYAVFNLRPLTPEQLAVSLATSTGYAEVVKAQKKKGELRAELEKDYKLFIEHYEDENDHFAATTGQALFMTFNKTTQKYLQPVAGNLSARLIKTNDAETFAQEVYLSVLSRHPTRTEAEAISKYLQITGVPRDQLVRDVVWALLNSTEFRFVH